MKRYLLFAGVDYYPEGGFNDYVNSYSTYNEALEDAQKLLSDGNQWWQIVDTLENTIIAQNGFKTIFIPAF